jgi:WD40 repeat protein
MDNSAKLWTLDGALERTFQVDNYVNGVAVLPDGVHFVLSLGLGNNCGEVRLYNVDGTLVHTFVSEATQVIWPVAVTRDGQHVISGGFDHRVRVWNVSSRSLVCTCGEEDNEDDDIGHTNIVPAVAAMPDGQRILSGAGDCTVRVWLLDGTLENTFELHNGWVSALVALPDNQHALSGSYDKTIKLFDVNDGTVLRTFKGHTDFVRSLALLPDGRRFASGADDGGPHDTARIFEHGLAPFSA